MILLYRDISQNHHTRLPIGTITISFYAYMGVSYHLGKNTSSSPKGFLDVNRNKRDSLLCRYEMGVSVHDMMVSLSFSF